MILFELFYYTDGSMQLCGHLRVVPLTEVDSDRNDNIEWRNNVLDSVHGYRIFDS